MSKHLLLVLILVVGGGLAAAGQSQTMANQGSENWAIRSGIEAPTGWQTSDDFIEQLLPPYARINTGTVTKTNDAHAGQYAAQLRTTMLPAQGTALLFGLLALGTNFRFLNTTTGTFGGQAYTGRPASFQFYYKLSGPQAVPDAPLVDMLLTRHVNGQTVTVGFARYQFSGLAATYTLATAPIFYFSSLTPDSIQVNAWSGTQSRLTAGTTLLLDDFALVGGTVTATRSSSANAMLTAFPNPSLDGRFTLAATDPSLLVNSFVITDLAGQVVLHGEATQVVAPRNLDLSTQPPGVYTLQMATKRGLLTRKLVVQ